MSHRPAHALPVYYALEAASSFASTLFLYCAYFWAREVHGYSNAMNLAMGAAQGLAYVICSLSGGRRADRHGYDTMLKACYPVLVMLLLTTAFLHQPAVPFILTTLFIAVLAHTWPALEGAIMHAPSRISMPARLGIFNLAWSCAGAAGYFLGGWLFEQSHALIFWVPAAAYALMVLRLLIPSRLRAADDRRQSAMQVPHKGLEVPAATKRRFLHIAWLANAAAYFMISSFLALAPHVGERLGLPVAQAIWISCLLFFSRAAAFLACGRWEGWHYQARWSLAALWLAPVCLAAMFFSTSIPLTSAALLLFGLAIGLSYNTSIYYSLDYGDNKGEHGGLHEAMLGLGILGGPLVGAVATGLLGTEAGKAIITGAALLLTAGGLAFIRRRH